MSTTWPFGSTTWRFGFATRTIRHYTKAIPVRNEEIPVYSVAIRVCKVAIPVYNEEMPIYIVPICSNNTAGLLESEAISNNSGPVLVRIDPQKKISPFLRTEIFFLQGVWRVLRRGIWPSKTVFGLLRRGFGPPERVLPASATRSGMGQGVCRKNAGVAVVMQNLAALIATLYGPSRNSFYDLLPAILLEISGKRVF